MSDLHRPVDPERAAAFLTGHRLAVVGASDDPKNFGRTICRELAGHGHEVVAVHPSATAVDGLPCVPTLAAVEGHLDGVIVMVPADASADVVRQCVDRGVTDVWLFQGIGSAGAVSTDALRLCDEHGIEVIAGACPLMFLEPVGWFHRLHRSARRHRGALVASAG